MLTYREKEFIADQLAGELAVSPGSLYAVLLTGLPLHLQLKLRDGPSPMVLARNAVALCIEDGYAHDPPALAVLLRTLLGDREGIWEILTRINSEPRTEKARASSAGAPPSGPETEVTTASMLAQRRPLAAAHGLHPSRRDTAKTHVVVLVHGIRDFALWQTTVRSTFEQEGFQAEPTNYGRFNLLQFLIPFSYFRNKAIGTVWNQIRIIKQNNEGALLSVVAHSFGTFVVAYLIQEHFDVKFHRVIFCVSVVRYGFPFEQFQNRFTQPIINEVGTRDIWPAIAESITLGYGSAGTYGFQRPLVRDRWHNGARHGYFLDAEFCKKFWSPFLRDGTFVAGASAPESPRLWLQSLSIVKVKYLVATLTLVYLINIGYDKATSWLYTTNAAACLQKFIDKPDPEGHTNKALVASKARALGAKLPLDILVIEWVADPRTDANQLAAVARQVACSPFSSFRFD